MPMRLLRKDWFAALCLAAAVLVADLDGAAPTRWADGYLYDFSQQVREKRGHETGRLALVTLDADATRSSAERRRAARLIDALHASGAGSVALLLPLDRAEINPAHRELERIGEFVASAELPGGPARTLAGMIEGAESRLDVDGRLAAAAGEAGNVVLTYHLRPLSPPPPTLETLPDRLADLLEPRGRDAAPAPLAGPPLPTFAGMAAAVAPMTLLADDDGTVRALTAHLPGADGEPTLPLTLAARLRGKTPESLAATLAIAPRDRLYPNYYIAPEGGAVFDRYTAAEILAGDVAAEALRGRAVLVAPADAPTYPSPLGTRLSLAEHVAHATAAVLDRDTFRRPPLLPWIELAAFVGLTLLLAFALPRLGATLLSIVALLLLLALLGVEQYLLLGRQVWLQIGAPLTLLAAGYALLVLRRLYARQHLRHLAALSDANRQLGLALQERGKLELALERFQMLPATDSNLELVYNLALDFERRRKFNTAESVYRYILRHRPHFLDVPGRLSQAKQMAQAMALGTGRFTATGGGLVEGADQQPMLGRYVVEKELGSGAMGTVYLGRDPKIDRTVAIKTLAISEEFEPDEVSEVEYRFFHEASAAGRLNHPHIVTIYDAAEEHDLAYIAMEYIRGRPLSHHARKDHLLPIPTVLRLVAQAADALDYAHGRDIIHRDIKPGNLMYDEASGSVKITDFGIARISSSGHTKTGMILGTPSYMSPEQMNGRHVDGRSDIFSLGATLFVLLTGKKAFSGDSLAAVSYQVVNEKHPDITELRPEIPPCVKRIVDKAMQKKPERRYQSGGAMKRAISRCLNEIARGD